MIAKLRRHPAISRQEDALIILDYYLFMPEDGTYITTMSEPSQI